MKKKKKSTSLCRRSSAYTEHRRRLSIRPLPSEEEEGSLSLICVVWMAVDVLVLLSDMTTRGLMCRLDSPLISSITVSTSSSPPSPPPSVWAACWSVTANTTPPLRLLRMSCFKKSKNFSKQKILSKQKIQEKIEQKDERVLRRRLWPPPRFGRIAGKFKSSQNSNSVLVSAGAEGGRLHLRCCLHECSQESDQNAVGGSSGTWPPGTQRLGFFFFSHGFLVSLCAQVSSCLLFAPPSQWIPEHKHWRLNERHYGALQGLDKAETAAKHGEEQVKIWRRAYATPPPALEKTDERFPGGAFLFFPVPLF